MADVPEQTVDVVALTKLKHGALRDAVLKFGSQSALGKELGVTPQTIGKWCNFKDYPREGSTYDNQTFEDIEIALYHATGQLVDDLWPAALKAAIDGRLIPQQIERRATLQADALLEYAAHTQERLTYKSDTPLQLAENEELRNDISNAMDTLTDREREILTLRFGLADGHPCTLEEIGRIFKTTKERIRQIEAKAIRKLQGPSRSQQLVSHLD